jgi:hypothetical protein
MAIPNEFLPFLCGCANGRASAAAIAHAAILCYIFVGPGCSITRVALGTGISYFLY